MTQDTLEALRARQDELVADSQAILARADAEKRESTTEEQAQIDSNSVEFDRLDADCQRREKVMAQQSSLFATHGRRTAPPAVGQGDEPEQLPALPPDRFVQARERQRVPAEPRDPRDYGRWGFRSIGEFAMAVRRAPHGQLDPRLDYGMKNAATTYGNESVAEQGGILVPPDFRNDLMQKVLAPEALLSRTDQLTSGSNTFHYPQDPTTPWQTSGGIQAFWEQEAGIITQSRPLFTNNSLRLNKLTALVPVTEELLEDAPALDSYLRVKAPDKINFKLDLAIVQGTGVGQPLGIMNSPATIVVPKETGQAADSIVAANIERMWTSMYAPCRSRAVWLANQDLEIKFFGMTKYITNIAGTENVGGTPVFLPPGGYSQSPYGTLFGRPIIYTEALETAGDKGDLILADLSLYLSVRKAIGLRVETSIHLYFDQDMTAYRFVLRVGGHPWWDSPVLSRDVATPRSCFCVLAERA